MRISDWSSDVCSSDLHLLLPDGGIGGTAAHGEVVAADHDRAAVEAAATEDEIGRAEIAEFAGGIVNGAAGNGAHFMASAGIEQLVDAFEHSQLAARKSGV